MSGITTSVTSRSKCRPFTIPSDPSSPSLNLAQSVLLVAYELSRKTYWAQFPRAVTRPELEILHQHIHDTLRLLEYIPRGNRDLEARRYPFHKNACNHTNISLRKIRSR